jgi:hypothetical protein
MKTRGVIELSACTLEYACGERLESEDDEASFELARVLLQVRAHPEKGIEGELVRNRI